MHLAVVSSHQEPPTENTCDTLLMAVSVHGSTLTCTEAGTWRDQSDRQELHQVDLGGHQIESRFYSKSNMKLSENFKLGKYVT